MSLIPKSKCKTLLKDSGKWVLDHLHGTYVHPKQKPETSIVFQEKVEEYAWKLALASNIVARDAPHIPEGRGWPGQHWRSGRNREMILPVDIEIAAHALENKYLSVPYVIGKEAETVGPERCLNCDQEFTVPLDVSGGWVCPHCYHIIVSMSMAYKEGDPIPQEEVEKIKGGI